METTVIDIMYPQIIINRAVRARLIITFLSASTFDLNQSSSIKFTIDNTAYKYNEITIIINYFYDINIQSGKYHKLSQKKNDFDEFKAEKHLFVSSA